MLKIVSCLCGGSDNLIRNKLSKFGYADAVSVPIVKGKEKSLSVLNTLPQYPEVAKLHQYISGLSKWAIIIGYDNEQVKWVDLANGSFLKNDVDAELLLKHFA